MIVGPIRKPPSTITIPVTRIWEMLFTSSPSQLSEK